MSIPQERGRPRRRFEAIAGDKGYCGSPNRKILRDRGMRCVIPGKSNERPRRGRKAFNKRLYRRRNVIERCIGWLKENRRIATRHEKKAESYLSLVKMAFIQRYFRVLDLRGTA